MGSDLSLDTYKHKECSSNTKYKIPQMKIKFLLIASIFMTSSVYSQEKWSLKKCVDYALENNISIKQSALSISLSERDVAITQGNFLPTIGASSSGGINSGLSPDQTGVLKNTTNFNGRFNLGVNGTIFNGFRNLNSYKQAQLGIESSKLDLEKAQNDVSLFVVNGYLNILFAKENLSVAKVQSEISKKQVEAASQRFEAGIIPKGDLLNTQSTAANDQQNVIARENTLTLALLNLAQLLQISSVGFDIEDMTVNSPSGLLLYESSDVVYEKALTTQPQIKSAELGIQNANLNIELSKGAFLPSLNYSISGGTSYFNQMNNLFPGQKNEYFFKQVLKDRVTYGVSLSLNIPIFNRFQTKNNVAKSYINRELSLLNLDNQKLQLQQTIEQAFADAKAASKTFEAATISLKSQREAFKNAQESYNLGASTLFDFDLVRTRLVSAESALIRAKYDFVFKTKVLQFYYGDFNLD